MIFTHIPSVKILITHFSIQLPFVHHLGYVSILFNMYPPEIWHRYPKEPCLKSEKYIFQTFDGRAWILATLPSPTYLWRDMAQKQTIRTCSQTPPTRNHQARSHKCTTLHDLPFLESLIWYGTASGLISQIEDGRQSMECGLGNFSSRYCPGKTGNSNFDRSRHVPINFSTSRNLHGMRCLKRTFQSLKIGHFTFFGT